MVITPEEKLEGLIKIYKEVIFISAENLLSGDFSVETAEQIITDNFRKLRAMNAKNTAL